MELNTGDERWKPAALAHIDMRRARHLAHGVDLTGGGGGERGLAFAASFARQHALHRRLHLYLAEDRHAADVVEWVKTGLGFLTAGDSIDRFNDKPRIGGLLLGERYSVIV